MALMKWKKGFLTNSNKDQEKYSTRTYREVVEDFEKSGIPIVCRDDATDNRGNLVPYLIAIYVDLEAIKGKISVDEAIRLCWACTKDGWDGVRWDPDGTDTVDAYDRAMQIL